MQTLFVIKMEFIGQPLNTLCITSYINVKNFFTKIRKNDKQKQYKMEKNGLFPYKA